MQIDRKDDGSHTITFSVYEIDELEKLAEVLRYFVDRFKNDEIAQRFFPEWFKKIVMMTGKIEQRLSFDT